MRQQRESGMVSILTVIFFMIFVSLIVVGYMGIVSYDQRQTVDADLSASALAAARSGVEEGKRILLYCEQNPGAIGCSEILNSTDCKTFSSTNARTLANQLKININSDGQGVIAGQDTYQQYFTCMIITRATPEVKGIVLKDSDYIVKLDTNGAAYDSLNISWTSDTGSFAYPTSPTVNVWTQEGAWTTGGVARPPVLRIQLVPYTPASFTAGADPLSTIEYESQTVFLVPCTATALMCNYATKVLPTLEPLIPAGANRGGNAPVTYAACSNTTGYSCKVSLRGLVGGAKTYYVRASLVYGASTSITLGPWDSSASQSVNLFNVQPRIDVTGRTNDVFRRLQAEVSHDPGGLYVKNAIDSAAPICKDMFVTSVASSSRLNCN